MPMLLKIVEDHSSPVDSDNVHSVHADIMSCRFNRHPDGSATATCYIRDEIKTALVPGFAEHETFIGFTGTAYLMNDRGKTISTFTALTSGQEAQRSSVNHAQTFQNDPAVMAQRVGA